MPALMDAYRDLYPGVTIELVISNTEQVKSAVLGQRCQLGLIEGPYGDDAFDVLSLGDDEIIAVVGPQHPLARRRRLNASALSDVELVMREEGSGTREVVAHAYAAQSLALEPGLVVGSQEAIKRLLRIGRAVSWVSRLSVRDELEAGSLVELPITDIRVVRQLNMLWRKNQSLSPAARAFHSLTTGGFA
jgi:DNA-binding transcriptional LysR family regulator